MHSDTSPEGIEAAVSLVEVATPTYNEFGGCCQSRFTSFPSNPSFRNLEAKTAETIRENICRSWMRSVYLVVVAFRAGKTKTHSDFLSFPFSSATDNRSVSALPAHTSSSPAPTHTFPLFISPHDRRLSDLHNFPSSHTISHISRKKEESA